MAARQRAWHAAAVLCREAVITGIMELVIYSSCCIEVAVPRRLMSAFMSR
jgi:hypothetical protein